MPPSKNNKINSPFSKKNQHDQKYKTILSAASELFNVYGTRGTTLIQIAEKLNLTKTSLYYYAKNKEELVHQCYLNTCTELQAMITRANNTEGSAMGKIECLLRLNFDCLNGIMNGTRGHLAGFTEISSLSTQHKKEISGLIRTFVIQVMALIELGKNDGSIQNVHPAKTASALCIRGTEKNSKSYYEEDKYFVQPDQLYGYSKKDSKSKKNIWFACKGFNFVSPIKETKMLTTKFEKPLVGVLTIKDKNLIGVEQGDLVGFTPSSEYEFMIGTERVYRVPTNSITIKYEYKGDEKKYNPSWAQSG